MGELGISRSGLSGGAFGAFLHRFRLDIRGDLADCVLPGHLGDFRLVVAEERGDCARELAAVLGGGVDIGGDVVFVGGPDLEAGGANGGVDEQLRGVERGGVEQIHLGGALALGVVLDLALKVVDGGDALHELGVEEGDAVIAREESEAGFGAGGDLGEIAFAGDGAVSDEVDVEGGGEGVDIDGDIEVGEVVEVVQGGLEVDRGAPDAGLVAGSQGVQGGIDGLEGFVTLGDGGGGVVLAEGGAEVVGDEGAPFVSVGLGLGVRGGGHGLEAIDQATFGPGESDPGTEPFAEGLSEVDGGLPGDRTEGGGDLVDAAQGAKAAGVGGGGGIGVEVAEEGVEDGVPAGCVGLGGRSGASPAGANFADGLLNGMEARRGGRLGTSVG